MKIFLKFFLVFSALGVAMGQSALAQKITVEYGYYEDHFDSVSPNNLSSINFKPSDNTINMPFGTHAHWLKINIKNKVDAPLILRVKPTYLDHIVLYGTVNKRVVPIKEHGDTILGSLTESNDTAYRFKIESKKENTTYYLKTNTSSNVSVYVEVLTNDSANDQRAMDAFFYGGYIATALIFIIFSTILLRKRKNILTALLWATIFFGTLSVLLRTGIIDYFFEQSIYPSNLFTTAITSLSVLLFVQFSAEFIRTELKNKIIHQLTTGSVIASAFYIVLATIFTGTIPTKILMYMYLINYSLGIYIYVKSILFSKNIVLILLGAVLILFGFYNIILNMGLINGRPIDVYFPITRNIGQYFFFTYLVLQIIREEEIKKKNLTLANELKTASTYQEKSRRYELEKIIGLLLHEIKTPLAIIQLAVDNLKNQLQNIDPQSFKRLKKIADSATHINDIISKSSELEKENHIKQLELSKLDLRKTLEKLSARFEQNRLKIICPDDVYVMTNEFTFEVILNNLIDNACKHSITNSIIKIDVDFIKDNLSKIAQISISNYFDDSKTELMASKYHSSIDMKSGTSIGLGLWLVNELCKTLNLDISNEIIENSIKFKILVPLCPITTS